MNILVAAISVTAVAFLLLSSNQNIPESMRPGLSTTLLALGIAGLFILASVLALLHSNPLPALPGEGKANGFMDSIAE
jgi:hypothetical protein